MLNQTVSWCVRVMLALSLLATVACTGTVVDTPISQAAVDRADQFLKTHERGESILGYLHLGADYHGHEYVKTIDRGGGSFALVYRFHWESDGVTDVEFLCDEQGNVGSLRIEDSNAALSPPFVVANLTIAVLGNAVLNSFKDDMSEEDHRQVQRLIDDADAKRLLEWSLRFQQLNQVRT
jgi:hypothetical protein